MAVQSLLSVLAFIANSDATHLVDLLSRANGGTGDGPSALQVALAKWTERHMEIRTPYDIKMSILQKKSQTILLLPIQIDK